MSTLGIIVEYNPFHNGHLFHVNQAKKIVDAKTTIAVMSGPFLQRGEPAIIDKWARTKMALSQGIDLVIELPTIYATQSADWFALGSVSILHHLQVDHLIFGSETNSLDILDQVSDILLDEPPLFRSYMKEELSLGHSYPKALSLSLQHYFNQGEFSISTPNDILGIQYVQNLKKLNSKIKYHTVKRVYANYHDQEITDQPVASATAIRKKILKNNSLNDIEEVVPASTYNILLEEFQNNRFNAWNNFFQTLQIIASCKNIDQIKNIHGVVEGFQKRIKEYIPNARSFEELLQLLKTKRYTMTKIQRTLLYLLLDITNEKVEAINVNAGPSYLRVLGFNEKGRQYLNKMKHSLNLPILTNISKEKNPMLELDITASMVYELGFNQPTITINEYKQAPIYLRE